MRGVVLSRVCIGVQSRVFRNTFGDPGVERRSYPVLTWEDRRSTGAARRKALRTAPELRRNSAPGTADANGPGERRAAPPLTRFTRCGSKRRAAPKTPRG